MMPANAPLGGFQPPREDDGLVAVDPVPDRNRCAQAAVEARPRGLEVVAVADIDVGRRPGGGRDDELSVLVRDHDVEDVRHRCEMPPHRVVHLLGVVDGPKLVGRIDVEALAGASDLEQHPSIVFSERDNWPARIAAMFPVSVIADLIASFRSCQIVKPTAPMESASRTIAAHHRRRSGIGFSDGVAVGAGCARSMSAADGLGIVVEPSRRSAPALRFTFKRRSRIST